MKAFLRLVFARQLLLTGVLLSLLSFSCYAAAECWRVILPTDYETYGPTLPAHELWGYLTSSEALEAGTKYVVEQTLGQTCGLCRNYTALTQTVSGHEISSISCSTRGTPPSACEFVRYISYSGELGLCGSSSNCGGGDNAVVRTRVETDGPWPTRLCPQNYVVKLSPVGGQPESSTVLTSAEPGSSAALVAKVYDQNNQRVPNVGIELKLEAVNQSGGHHHGDDTAVARTGSLATTTGGAIVTDNGKTLTGNTGTNGLQFQYHAPVVSGDIDINATRCTDGKNCTQEGARRVWVGIKGLEPIVPASDPASGPLYVLIGQDGYHPNNHYMRPDALGRLQHLAALYRQRFPNDAPLHLNDASLERGGLFDIYYNFTDANGIQHERNAEGWWKPPHEEHRRGTVVDVRANTAAGAVPFRNHQVLMQLARGFGADAKLHSPGTNNQHFHVRLMGVAE